MADDSDAPSVRRDTIRLTVGLDAAEFETIHGHESLWFDGVSGAVLEQLIALGVIANDTTTRLPPVTEFVEFFDTYEGFQAFGWVTELWGAAGKPRVYVTGCEMAATDFFAPHSASSREIDYSRYQSLKQAVWERFSRATRLELTPELVQVDYCFSPPHTPSETESEEANTDHM